MRGSLVLGIRVFVGAGLLLAALNAQTPAPTITGVFPSTAPTGDNVPITVSGNNFTSCMGIRFETTNLATTPSGSGSFINLTATIPASLITRAGNYQITVVRFAQVVGTASLICTSTVQATSNVFNFVVFNALTITSASPLPAASQGQSYSFTFQAAGGRTGSAFFSAATGTLPAGLTLNANGLLSGTPTVTGTFSFTVRVVDCNTVECQQTVDTKTFSLTIVPALNITTPSLASGSLCSSYSQTMAATGGQTPLTWTASGLPPGLSISQAGVITGTPTQQGSFPVDITVRDGLGTPKTTRYTLVIGASLLSITTTSMAGGKVGTSYGPVSLAATGSQGSLTWSVDSGMPPGLAISPGGVVSGTPTQPGTFSPVFRVTDGTSCPATRTLQIVIAVADLQILTSALDSGRVGIAYTATLQGTGGSLPFNWVIPSGQLPTGLSLNSSTGVISGTPQVPGSFVLNVSLTDSGNRSANKQLTLQISSGLTILTTSLPAARVNQAYETTLQASGAFGNVTWTSPTTPPGLVLTSTGVLSGIPTSAGDFSINITARDTNGGTANRIFTLNIVASLNILTESPLPTGRVGVNYTANLAANGGVTPFRWVALGAMPPNLTLDLFGSISGIPQQAGTFSFSVQVTDAANGTATKDFQVTFALGFTITTPALPNGTVNSLYNQTLLASGGRNPLTWSVDSGQLPRGLNLASATGILNGTPTQAGDFTFTIAAVDADAVKVTKQFTITIRGTFNITTSTLPGGVVGNSYSQTLASTGGVSPFVWTVSTGSLPTGLQLARTTGVLSGTPTAAGTFDFTVNVTDGSNQSASVTLRIVITAAIPDVSITTSSLPGGRVNSSYAVTLEATGGTPPYTWSQTGLPQTLTLDPDTGEISGTPTQAATINVTITARDSSARTATARLSIVIASGLAVTTASLPDGTVGVAYSQTLQATGGTGLAWRIASGALPAGLNLAASGAITGTPSRSGTGTFTAEVRDGQGTTAASPQLTIGIGDLTVSAPKLMLDGTVAATQQPKVAVELTDPAPANLQGTLRLSFVPESGITLPSGAALTTLTNLVAFSGPATFTVANGQRTAVFPQNNSVLLSLGTVAGTVTMTASFTAGGVDVTPNPAPSQTFRLTRSAPTITNMTACRTGNNLSIVIDGFATGRELTSADLQFATRAGSTVQGASLTQQLSTQSSSYFSDGASAPFGGTFRVTLPFSITGNSADITGVTATVVNATGRSAASSKDFVTCP